MTVSLVFFIKSFSVTSTTALLVCRELGNKKPCLSLSTIVEVELLAVKFVEVDAVVHEL